MNRRLKITFIILLIILLSIISFVGLFIQNTKFMKNILPEYQLGMALDGYRNVSVKVSEETETIYYDKDGNKVTEKAEDGTSEEVPVNSKETLTKENFEKTKKIIADRFTDLGVSEYYIRLNEQNGEITVQLPENSLTDTYSQFIYTKGKFTIEDEDGQVLLDNSNLKSVQAAYGNTNAGVSVFLNFEFNKDSIEKLREISTTYVESTDEDGNDTTKQVKINVDGNTLVTTSFSEEITNGFLQLTLGTSTDNDTISSYLEQGSNIAILLDNGVLPIEYEVEQNRFIKSDITMEDFIIPAIVVSVILVVAFIFAIVKYKKIGLLAVISYIGYIAILLLIVRYTNLVITLEGIGAILTLSILNYAVVIYLMSKLSKAEQNIAEYKNVFKKSILTTIFVLVPAMIIGIVLCFAMWLPAYSFGTIIFWGLLIMPIYNELITRTLFVNSIK